MTLNCSTLCLKKVPTFILSVTLSNVNKFSHFCLTGKRMNFATKSIRQYPLHLRRIATLPWEIKISNFWPPVNCACVPQRFYRATACNATHGIAVAILSVCPSVCPSVRPSVRCVYCEKTKQRTANILIPHETAITLVF